MKTVEELAQQVGAHIVISLEASPELVQRKLEALCNAFMKDRLESLEPVAWFICRFDGYKETKFYYNVNPLIDTATPLHDISSLKE